MGRPRTVTAADLAVAELLYNDGVTWAEIYAALPRHPEGTVNNMICDLRRRGRIGRRLPVRPRAIQGADRMRIVLEQRSVNMPWAQIAAGLGISRVAMHKWAANRAHTIDAAMMKIANAH